MKLIDLRKVLGENRRILIMEVIRINGSTYILTESEMFAALSTQFFRKIYLSSLKV